MTGVDFEARYRADPDPWSYETSAYEHAKYRDTLAACGPGPFRRGLELGGSIGVFSALLAPRCRSLVTIDRAPTAVAAARRRLARMPGVTVRLGTIPRDIPALEYDLVVASEVLYYLSESELQATLGILRRRTPAGARVVAVHWRPAGPERPLTAADVHGALCDVDWLRPVRQADTADYLLGVWQRT